MRIIVAGSREFADYALLERKMNRIVENLDSVIVINGTARGADRLGSIWAHRNGHEVVNVPANWNRYGRSAGYRRNEEMAQQADALVAFWNGKSRGTEHMIRIARERGLKVRVIRYDLPC